jgi:hypothetical protein
VRVNDDRLEQLLRRTDRTAAPAPVRAVDLVEGILLQARRRKVRSQITVTAAALFLCLGITAWLLNGAASNHHPSSPTLATTIPSNTADLRTELASVQREIATREAAVDRLFAIERRSRAQEQLARLHRHSLSPEDPADRAAFCVLFQADRLAQQTGSTESAQQAYREIIAYFPDSPSAESARQRLARIQKEG